MKLRERIAAVKTAQKRLGRYCGGKKPFGFDVRQDGSLIEISEQQRAILLMKELRSKGMALRAISQEIRTSTGLIISHRGVASVLRR